jgi:hypothetical protein
MAFPPPARDAATRTRATRTDGRPAPDPAGEKRPPRAGRALAGGFGPPAGQGSAWRCGRGDGPCHGNGAGGSHSDCFPDPGGTRKRTAFPPPARNAATKTRATRTKRGQRPTRRARSARRGRGGRWPGALGPRRAKGQRDAVAGAMAPAIAAGRAGGTVSRIPVRQPMRPALFQHPFRPRRLPGRRYGPCRRPLSQSGHDQQTR